MSRDVELLTEIRDLLEVIAEPLLAKRDAQARSALRKIAKAPKRAKAVVLMDGNRSQSDITKECGIDKGDLSRLVKSLGDAGLLNADATHPHLSLKIPPTFFHQDHSNE